MTDPVRIARGGLYLSAGLCADLFAGLEAVVLLRRACDLMVLPVRLAAAGGYLLKQRNAAGDRRVEAADFLRLEGIADEADFAPAWAWEEEAAALCLAEVFVAMATDAPVVSSFREPT
jgi:hypothetical protein